MFVTAIYNTRNLDYTSCQVITFISVTAVFSFSLPRKKKNKFELVFKNN